MLVTRQQPRWTTLFLCSLRLLSSLPRREAAEGPTKTCQGDSSILWHRVLYPLCSVQHGKDAAAKCSLNLCVYVAVWEDLCELKFSNSHHHASGFPSQHRTLDDKSGLGAAEGAKCSTQFEGRESSAEQPRKSRLLPGRGSTSIFPKGTCVARHPVHHKLSSVIQQPPPDSKSHQAERLSHSFACFRTAESDNGTEPTREAASADAADTALTLQTHEEHLQLGEHRERVARLNNSSDNRCNKSNNLPFLRVFYVSFILWLK